MPDTGAPWNIPYVDPTDLVRDYPQASEDLAEAIADGLDAAGNAGIGSNVVQTVKTDVFSTTSSSYTDITGLTATITPSSATSKILVVAQMSVGISETDGATVYLRLNGGNSSDYVGDTAGSRTRAAGMIRHQNADLYAAAVTQNIVLAYLDSPSSASAVTYAAQIFRSNGTAYINRAGQDADAAEQARLSSSITLIEVEA